MSRSWMRWLAVVVLVALAGETAEAEGKRGQQQNRMAVAGNAAGGQALMMQRGGGGGGGGMPDSAQLAQMLIANFDQNGDATLNVTELQLALAALQQRIQTHQQCMQGGGQNVQQRNQFRQNAEGEQAGQQGRQGGRGGGGPMQANQNGGGGGGGGGGRGR